jgi:pilus assembly protein Flp/PilA
MIRQLIDAVRVFLRDESGPTAVEYAVMIGLVITACIAGIQLVGGNTGDSFVDSSSKIGNATGS